MHVPDGFLDVPTSIATGVLAAAAIGIALRRSGPELQEAGPARAGLTGCFVFAAQMLNFPVAAGTSGHLIGAALAVALVGPWTALLTLSCVLLVQALVFADGGVSALGTNIVLLAVVPVAVSALVSRAVLGFGRGRRSAVIPGAAAAALVSVPLSALVFSGLYGVGGRVEVPLGLLVGSMTGIHLVIGMGEALITSAVLASVLAARPDLVHLWRGRAEPVRLVVTDAYGITRTVAADPNDPVEPGRTVPGRVSVAPRRHSTALVGLGVAAILAGGVSLLASGAPDGLERVALSLGFAGSATDSFVAGSPLAEYALVGTGLWGNSVAGLAGVVLTLGLTLLVMGVSVRSRARRPVPLPADTGRRR